MCALAVMGTSEIEHFDFRLGGFARLRVGTAYLEGNVHVGSVIQEQAGGVSPGAGEAEARRTTAKERTETGQAVCGQG